MKADFQRAAIKAAETLIQFKVHTLPVSPLRILKELENVQIKPFADIALKANIERDDLLTTFGDECRAAVTSMIEENGEHIYFVAYSQLMPEVLLQRSLARELGHIMLEHDGSRPVEVRMQEAYCFAHHFLSPRAVVKLLQESPYPLTVETFGGVTGCYQDCLNRLSQLPGVDVPAEMNRKIKEQFAPRIKDFIRYQRVFSENDKSAAADFGTFMDGYAD